jgi:flavin-dependent dehydrogenase
MGDGGGLGPLTAGSQVVVLGGGPAGVACALTLQRHALAESQDINVTILEGKEFVEERHHNQCVGVLSPPLAERLEVDLGIPFPDHLVRTVIDEYVLHSSTATLALSGEGIVSHAVRRVQFDAYMLDQARARGVRLMPARAVDLEFHRDGVVVYTEAGSIDADVVVGAFGMDEGAAAVFQRVCGYRPPQALSSVVTKYHPGDEAMEAFGPRIHAFLPRDGRIEFGGVTPKGNHLTINIAGTSVDSALMQSFLGAEEVRRVLPELDRAGRLDANDLRCFKGRFPISLAGHVYGDRWVTVGDAAGLVRAFKGKGVTSAVETGIRAARSMLRSGLSEAAFRGDYWAANRELIADIPYGRGMRLAVIGLARWGLFDVIVQAAAHEPRLHSALFEAVSGHSPYRHIWRKGLAPRSLGAIAREVAVRHVPAQRGQGYTL